MKIVCQMNMPTPQQEHFYRELAQVCELTVVYLAGISEERRRLGWDVVPKGYTHFFLCENSHALRRACARADFVLLSGLPGSWENFKCVVTAGRENCLAVQSEMRMPSMQTSRRRIQTVFYTSLLRKKRVPVFAIGPAMRAYCAELGIPDKLVFPFAYFSAGGSTRQGCWDGPIIFVGQLSYRKGVHTLVRAFASSSAGKTKRLLLVGDGDQRQQLLRLATDLGIADRVTIQGVVPQEAVLGFVKQASVLVLPSRFDGWGFVVNEAMSVGVPVIVSDRCGVAEVITNQGGGVVFPSEDADGLARALDTILQSDRSWTAFADDAFRAHGRISARTGARYFISLVEYIRSGYLGKRPVAPWLATEPRYSDIVAGAI